MLKVQCVYWRDIKKEIPKKTDRYLIYVKEHDIIVTANFIANKNLLDQPMDSSQR